MSETEILTTQIGELVLTEIEEVERVEYAKDNGELSAFTIVMKSGKRFILAVSEIV